MNITVSTTCNRLMQLDYHLETDTTRFRASRKDGPVIYLDEQGKGVRLWIQWDFPDDYFDEERLLALVNELNLAATVTHVVAPLDLESSILTVMWLPGGVNKALFQSLHEAFLEDVTHQAAMIKKLTLGGTGMMLSPKESELLAIAREQLGLLVNAFSLFTLNNSEIGDGSEFLDGDGESLKAPGLRIGEVLDRMLADFVNDGEASTGFRFGQITIARNDQIPQYPSIKPSPSGFCFLLKFTAYRENSELLDKIRRLGNLFSFTVNETQEYSLYQLEIVDNQQVWAN